MTLQNANRHAIRDWTGEALNTAPDSDNEIHGDDMARAFGFHGALVPGVTITACLAHPAVVAWGEAFLERGRIRARVHRPLYDGEQFTVTTEVAGPEAYRAELRRPDGTLSATADVALPAEPASVPSRRGDPVAADDWQGEAATPERFEALRTGGCRALRYRWRATDPMAHYVRDPAAEAPPFTGDAPLANPGFVLACANWVFAANAHMNPWVHLQTDSRFFRTIPEGTDVIAEMDVLETFEKKGHRFADVRVRLFDAADDAPLAEVEQRAIYRLRGL